MSKSFLCGKETIGAELRNKLCVIKCILSSNPGPPPEYSEVVKSIQYINELSFLPELSHAPIHSPEFKNLKYRYREELRDADQCNPGQSPKLKTG